MRWHRAASLIAALLAAATSAKADADKAAAKAAQEAVLAKNAQLLAQQQSQLGDVIKNLDIVSEQLDPAKVPTAVNEQVLDNSIEIQRAIEVSKLVGRVGAAEHHVELVVVPRLSFGSLIRTVGFVLAENEGYARAARPSIPSSVYKSVVQRYKRAQPIAFIDSVVKHFKNKQGVAQFLKDIQAQIKLSKRHHEETFLRAKLLGAKRAELINREKQYNFGIRRLRQLAFATQKLLERWDELIAANQQLKKEAEAARAEATSFLNVTDADRAARAADEGSSEKPEGEGEGDDDEVKETDADEAAPTQEDDDKKQSS